MNKPSTIWIISTFCAMIIFTALGVITYRHVQKDRVQTANAYEADKQGRIRLAMWRMDTLATSILQEEDERSASAYSNPEHNKKSLPLSNQEQQNPINPLFSRAPDTSNLYLNILPHRNSQVISPQVYSKKYLVANNIDPNENRSSKTKLDHLENILSQPVPNITSNKLPPNSDYKALMCAAAQVSLDQWGNSQTIANNTVPNQNDFSYKGKSLSKGAIEKTNQPEQQSKFSAVEKGARQKAIARLDSKQQKAIAWQAKQHEKLAKKESPKPSIKAKKNPKKITTKKNLTAKTNDSAQTSPTSPETLLIQKSTSPTKPFNEPFISPFTTPFTAVWINKELMLVRKVTEQTGDIVQSVWLNTEILTAKLLAEIADLFPDANLTPAAQDLNAFLAGKTAEGDYRTMLKLPLQLNTNEFKQLATSPLNYFHGPIGLAWLGSLLAVLASYFMLRSVLNMSERRASFVSSVTHELRTPLTTFRLYSDLLSSGMVNDPQKQKDYLKTLKLEAERLTHLVDNVLSYSRIEKGSAKAKLETTSITRLMESMRDRLTERASQDSMNISVELDDRLKDQTIHADITAVEQIIFNLVDNACKYASGELHGDSINIQVTSTASHYQFLVEDQGSGIDPKEAKRLFRPFHKSATEAAETKPGVGLGLALCLRLARAMKGELSILSSTQTEGAKFQLSLPKK